MTSDDKALSQPEEHAEDLFDYPVESGADEDAPAPAESSFIPQAEAEEALPTSPEDGPTPEAGTPSEDEIFLAAMQAEATQDDLRFEMPRRGQLVEGTIASVTQTEILIDVGAKSEGMISEREFEALDPETLASLQIGQKVTVYVVTPEDRSGNIQLSLRRALEQKDWLDADQFMQSKDTIETKISGYNKGGLIVRFGRVRGFVPASQISADRRRRSNGATPDEKWGGMVGEDITVKVIEVDRGRNRLIMSERAAEREMRVARRSELLDLLEVGQVKKGRVVRLTDFGAFVDLGGIDGLVHLSELSWKHVAHPKDVLRVGEEIEVEIINIDRDRERIGLSRKNCLADPWDTVAEDYQEGQLVQGTVTKLTNFGAFARLVDNPAIEGLVHISELSDRRVKHPSEVVNEGDLLTLRIIRIEPDRRRLGLSLKQVDSEDFINDDWEQMKGQINEDAAAAGITAGEHTLEAEEAEPVAEEAEPVAEETQPQAVEESTDAAPEE